MKYPFSVKPRDQLTTHSLFKKYSSQSNSNDIATKFQFLTVVDTALQKRLHLLLSDIPANAGPRYLSWKIFFTCQFVTNYQTIRRI